MRDSGFWYFSSKRKEACTDRDVSFSVINILAIAGEGIGQVLDLCSCVMHNLDVCVAKREVLQAYMLDGVAVSDAVQAGDVYLLRV